MSLKPGIYLNVRAASSCSWCTWEPWNVQGNTPARVNDGLSSGGSRCQRHPNAEKILLCLSVNSRRETSLSKQHGSTGLLRARQPALGRCARADGVHGTGDPLPAQGLRGDFPHGGLRRAAQLSTIFP